MTDKPLEQMSKEELSRLSDLKESELRAADNSLAIVEAEDIRLGKEILLLQFKRKENAEAQSKAKHNVKRIQSELREIKNRYFRS